MRTTLEICQDVKQLVDEIIDREYKDLLDFQVTLHDSNYTVIMKMREGDDES